MITMRKQLRVQQKAQQQIPAPVRKVMQQSSERNKKARENRAVLQPLAAGCETLPSSQVPPRGVEPLSLD